MSNAALDWSYSLRGLGGTRSAVLHCLAYHHNGETGRCDPSAATLSAETGVCVREVIYCLGDLATLGLIDRVGQSGRSSRFVLKIGATPAPDAEVLTREKGRKRKPTPAPDAEVPCTGCTPAPDAPLHPMQDTPAPDALTPAPDAPKQERTGIEQEVEQPREQVASVPAEPEVTKPARRRKSEPTPEGQSANAIFSALCKGLGRTPDQTLAGRAMRGLTELVRAHGADEVTAAWSPDNVRSCVKAAAGRYPFTTFAAMLGSHSDSHERLAKHAGLIAQEIDQCQTKPEENCWAALAAATSARYGTKPEASQCS